MFKKTISLLTLITFVGSLIIAPSKAQAANVFNLPQPGQVISLTAAYKPTILRGLTIHKDNPFLFDFILDLGQDKPSGQALKTESEKLIKYFLATMAIPEQDLWVNLSPYEKNRIVPQALGQTDMGRDLLAQDYVLKQLTASLIYPEKDLGKKFWDRVYARAKQEYGLSQLPVNTFNKVWIMADKAEVYEHNQTVFVVNQHLKVMLEEDYLASSRVIARSETTKQSKNRLPRQANSESRNDTHEASSNKIQKMSGQLIRDLILPELEREVNEGKNFANLRQIFNSIILASWYKNNLKQALLNQVYSNQSKVNGINLQDANIKEEIYQQYLKAYKKGVFNYIKEDVQNGQTISRKYFSGGVDPAMAVHPKIVDFAAAATPLAAIFADNALVTARTSITTSDPAVLAEALDFILTHYNHTLYTHLAAVTGLGSALLWGRQLQLSAENIGNPQRSTWDKMTSPLWTSINYFKKKLNGDTTTTDPWKLTKEQLERKARLYETRSKMINTLAPATAPLILLSGLALGFAGGRSVETGWFLGMLGFFAFEFPEGITVYASDAKERAAAAREAVNLGSMTQRLYDVEHNELDRNLLNLDIPNFTALVYLGWFKPAWMPGIPWQGLSYNEKLALNASLVAVLGGSVSVLLRYFGKRYERNRAFIQKKHDPGNFKRLYKKGTIHSGDSVKIQVNAALYRKLGLTRDSNSTISGKFLGIDDQGDFLFEKNNGIEIVVPSSGIVAVSFDDSVMATEDHAELVQVPLSKISFSKKTKVTDHHLVIGGNQLDFKVIEGESPRFVFPGIRKEDTDKPVSFVIPAEDGDQYMIFGDKLILISKDRSQKLIIKAYRVAADRIEPISSFTIVKSLGKVNARIPKGIDIDDVLIDADQVQWDSINNRLTFGSSDKYFDPTLIDAAMQVQVPLGVVSSQSTKVTNHPLSIDEQEVVFQVRDGENPGFIFPGIQKQNGDKSEPFTIPTAEGDQYMIVGDKLMHIRKHSDQELIIKMYSIGVSSIHPVKAYEFKKFLSANIFYQIDLSKPDDLIVTAKKVAWDSSNSHLMFDGSKEYLDLQKIDKAMQVQVRLSKLADLPKEKDLNIKGRKFKLVKALPNSLQLQRQGGGHIVNILDSTEGYVALVDGVFFIFIPLSANWQVSALIIGENDKPVLISGDKISRWIVDNFSSGKSLGFVRVKSITLDSTTGRFVFDRDPRRYLDLNKFFNDGIFASSKPKDNASVAQESSYGGIDLNTSKAQWLDNKNGQGVVMNIDEALVSRIKREGIHWLAPRILEFLPVLNPWVLAGMSSPSPTPLRLAKR